MRRRVPVRLVCAISMVLAGPCGLGAGLPSVCTGNARRASLDFTLEDVAGRAVDLRDFRGRVIAINFWATWCKPCHEEIPWLREIHHAYRDAGLVLLGVSVDEEVARIAPFVAALRMDYPVLVGRGEEEFLESFGPLLGFPTTILVTRDGRVCLRHTGITQRSRLEAEIGELLSAR